MLLLQLFGKITIFLFLKLVAAELKTTYSENTTTENVINCAVEIANNNFNFRKETVVLYKDVDKSLVNTFIESYNGTVIVESKGDSTRQVVVMIESVQSFVKMSGMLKPDLKGKSLLSGETKFLILLFSNSKKIETINSVLWNYFVTDVIVVSTSNGNILLYTYFPYKNPLNCRNTESTLVSTWNKTLTFKNIYQDKMQNMNECPLYISTNKLKIPLTEKKIPLEIIKKTIIRLLSDVMNFTPIVSVREYISIDSLRARNWSDSLSDVIAGAANISTCTIPLGIDKLGLLDYSMPYFRVRLIWLAPPITAGPGWWKLLTPLNGYLWLILLIVTFLLKSLPFITKIKAINRFCSKYLQNAIKLQGTVFRIWGVLMGQPVHLAPKRFRDFYIIGLWIWFTFVVRNAYQSVLIGALKTDSIEGNFANLKETVTAGFKIGGLSGIYSHFENDSMIKERFEVVREEDFDNLFLAVIEGKKKFVLATSLEYATAFCTSQSKKEKECGHVLPDSIMSLPLVVWMKEHSPYKKSLSMWLPRLIEGGFLQRDATVANVRCCKFSSDPTPLTDHQIISCLLCLFIGYIVSFFVFIVEVLRFKTIKYTIEKKMPYRN